MKWLRDEITSGSLAVTCGIYHSGVPGTFVCEAHVNAMPYPIGLVWFRHVGNNKILESLNSFVMDELRRSGIRTKMHRYLIEAYPDVTTFITGNATSSGMKWLKATGFKQDRFGNWALRIRWK